MKNKLMILISGILLISIVSAIYPGECEIIKFPNQDEVNFTIISNTSSMEGFTWSKEGYDITYCFPTYLEPGNYSFEWSNYQDTFTEPEDEAGDGGNGDGGGGGTKTIYKYKFIPGEVITRTVKEPTPPEIINIERSYKKDFIVLGIVGIIILGSLVSLYFIWKKKKIITED